MGITDNRIQWQFGGKIIMDEIKPIHIDKFVRICGNFNSDTDVNNGYGCDHPKQEDIEEGQGRCFDFSCPIAISLHPQTEPEDRKYFSEDVNSINYWGNMSDEDWMLPDSPPPE